MLIKDAEWPLLEHDLQSRDCAVHDGRRKGAAHPSGLVPVGQGKTVIRNGGGGAE